MNQTNPPTSGSTGGCSCCGQADQDRAKLDIQLNNPGREGLAGTAPLSVYKPAYDPDQVTIAPDGRPMEDQPQWRRDFPIDWPQDHYVARRDFSKFLVLTSFAFLVGHLWIGVQNLYRKRRGRPLIRKIATLSELAVGSTIMFNYPGEHDACILTRTDEDLLLAYSQKCTHLACAVIPRPKEGVIHCPCHEGYFDLQSGRPVAGPPRRPLPRIVLEVRGDEIFAKDVEWRTV